MCIMEDNLFELLEGLVSFREAATASWHGLDQLRMESQLRLHEDLAEDMAFIAVRKPLRKSRVFNHKLGLPLQHPLRICFVVAHLCS